MWESRKLEFVLINSRAGCLWGNTSSFWSSVSLSGKKTYSYIALYMYGLKNVDKRHIYKCLHFYYYVINFCCENIVFLFPFQLQWKRRRRRKVKQLFSLGWSVFQAVTAVRNVSFIHWYNCNDIHHLMCYHQLALSAPTVITQLSFPALLAPFYHRPTQPGIRHFIVWLGRKWKAFVTTLGFVKENKTCSAPCMLTWLFVLCRRRFPRHI